VGVGVGAIIGVGVLGDQMVTPPLELEAVTATVRYLPTSAAVVT
jgi:hypothetical protein